MSSQTTEIKERLSIVDVISSYLKVEKAGKNFKAKCPFHNEKTPSFFISPDRQSYYCFGCNAKGDIFSFVQNFEGTDFLGALKILAEKAGVKLKKEGEFQSKDDKEKLYQIMEEATKFFESIFQKNQVQAYLKSRGLKDETIKNFRIGYAPSNWRSVSDHLIKKGFKELELEKVGLVKKGNSGFYDRFRSRIIFPITDSSGRVIAFSGRIFYLPNLENKEIEEAKYLNSPDTILFNKSNVLFGIDKAKNSIRSRGYSIIVEGQMDLILSHQTGFTNTVAISGTALSDTIETDKLSSSSENESKINNLGLIKRISSNIIFAFDGDEAGLRAASRAGMIALSLDMQVKIAVLPLGKDPADIIIEDSEKWKQIIKNSLNIVSFHIDKICQNIEDLRIRGRKIKEEVFPFLSMINSSIEKSSYIKEINLKTGIPEKAIIEDFQKYESSNNDSSFKKKEEINNKDISRFDLLLEKLFGIFFWQINNQEIKNEVGLIFDDLRKILGKEKFEELKEKYKPMAETLSFESEILYEQKEHLVLKDLKELILNIEEEILKEESIILLNEINKKTASKETLLKYQKIIEKIQDIKKRRTI